MGRGEDPVPAVDGAAAGEGGEPAELVDARHLQTDDAAARDVRDRRSVIDVLARCFDLARGSLIAGQTGDHEGHAAGGYHRSRSPSGTRTRSVLAHRRLPFVGWA